MSGEVDVEGLRRAAEQTKRADDKSWYEPDWTDVEWGAAVTPDVVLALLNEVERLRETVARVEALADRTDGLTGIHFMGSPFPPAVTLVDLRDSLSGAQDWRHTGTPDAQSARRSAAVGAKGHVSATDLAQAAARTKQAARGRVERGEGLA